MKDDQSISFVLPMFNEAENIERTVKTLEDLAGKLTDDHEIVIVDDASTDESVRIVEALASADRRIRLFRLEKNTKFGGAFARGFKEAKKDVIIYMDSDLPVKEEDVKASFELIHEFDIVTGCSKVKKGETFLRKIMSLVYNGMVQLLYGLSVKDINSGYKVVKRGLIDDLEFISHSPFVDVELFIHAGRKKAKVYQFPLVFLNREGGRSYIARIPVILATFRDMLRVRVLLKRG